MMKKGEIILVRFPFSDLSGSKYRPAIVLTETELDVTVSFITTQISWEEPFDILLKPTLSNGLKKESLIRTRKIATIEKVLVKGLLGEITKDEIEELNTNLKTIFQL